MAMYFFGAPLVIRTVLSYVSNCYYVLVIVILFWSFLLFLQSFTYLFVLTFQVAFFNFAFHIVFTAFPGFCFAFPVFWSLFMSFYIFFFELFELLYESLRHLSTWLYYICITFSLEYCIFNNSPTSLPSPARPVRTYMYTV